MKRTTYASAESATITATDDTTIDRIGIEPTPTTMQAAVQPRYGLEHLKLTDVDMPMPGPGEVRLQVHASSINPADWYLANGTPFIMRFTEGLVRPKARIAGLDAAGVIDAVGDGVTGFAVGDAVFGKVRGAFATHALADVAHLAHAPTTMTLAEAATLPIAAVTALQAVELAEVAGRRVVVNGASGGVGHFAVQLARAAGAAEVIGVCSGRNRDFVLGLGADRVVDYETDDITDETFDAFIDCVATQPTRRVLGALAEGGAWILVGAAKRRRVVGPLPSLVAAITRSRFAGRGCVWFVAEETTERLTRLAELVDGGHLRTHIAGQRPLRDVIDAYDRIESQRTAGKIIVIP